MIELAEALDRLLHRRSYREAFLAGRFAELDLAPEDLAALASIDRAELASAAGRVRGELLQRRHRGSGGVLALYPITLDAYQRAHPDDADLTELAAAWMETAAFEAYREIPHGGAGLSLEESFYRFAEDAEIGEASARESEFLAAIIKALVMSPRPSFTLPVEIRRAPQGHYAVGTRGAPTLFAALGRRFVVGPITPFLAELLMGSPPRDAAERFGVGAEALRASLEELGRMGLV